MKYKVLLVDDELAKRTAVAESLRDEGLHVFEASDGQAGLATALAEKPDMILLDIVMPIMDGLEMLTKLREDQWGKEAYVALFTSYADPDKVAKALKLGAYDYLLKSSLNLDEVVREVKDRLVRMK